MVIPVVIPIDPYGIPIDLCGLFEPVVISIDLCGDPPLIPNDPWDDP